MEGERVEFVIPHHCKRVPAFNHVSNNRHDVRNLGATIDEVAAKNGFASCVSKHALLLAIPKLQQHRAEFFGVAVDVSNDIVHGRSTYCRSC